MKPRRFVQALFVLLTISFAACALVKQLSDFKEKFNARDYAGIVQQNVSCKEVDDVCGQLHLIKGDACFRLAKQNTDAERNYACAVDELDKGIQFTKTWQQGEAHLNRPQRLLETSKRFLAAEPGNPATVYYNASARYTQLQRGILDPRNPQGLCQSLNAIIGDLDAAMPRASGTEYQTSMTRLRSDTVGVKRTVAGCN